MRYYWQYKVSLLFSLLTSLVIKPIWSYYSFLLAWPELEHFKMITVRDLKQSTFIMILYLQGTYIQVKNYSSSLNKGEKHGILFAWGSKIVPW